jgi:uncharacterized protein
VVRVRLGRILPVDPDSPVHSLALVLAVILLGTQLSSIAFTDVLATERAQPALKLADLVLQELPFAVLAYAGVGLFLRRGMKQATSRLGVVVPRWWQAAVALAAAGAFFAFGQAMDGLGQRLTPDIAHQVADATQHLFGGLNGPWAIAALALAPGICEELLFRGALQPRLGLVVAALLFTSLHTQYGLSLDALSVFAIALGLGFIRKYTNTSTSCLCHVTYNLLAGIGIAGPAVGVALVAEAGLVGYAGYALWTLRRRRLDPVRP